MVKVPLVARVLGVLSGLLIVAGVALFSPRLAVLTAGVLVGLVAAGQVEVGRRGDL